MLGYIYLRVEYGKKPMSKYEPVWVFAVSMFAYMFAYFGISDYLGKRENLKYMERVRVMNEASTAGATWLAIRRAGLTRILTTNMCMARTMPTTSTWKTMRTGAKTATSMMTTSMTTGEKFEKFVLFVLFEI